LHDELPLVPPKIVPHISGLHDRAAALLDLLPAGVRSCAVARTAAVGAAVLAELRDRGRWLLVFDNAEDPADVTPWLPGGRARSPRCAEIRYRPMALLLL
jgi:hypothetical protein